MPEYTPETLLSSIKRGDKLERADLRGVNFPKAPLEGVSLRRCDLEGANLEEAHLARCILKNTNLREAFLARADMRGANLENADLEGANLEGANLQNANLSRANLEGANLTGADLTGAKITYAQLDSAKMRGADLSRALLSHSNLVECHLANAKFTQADLSNASFRGADLTEAELGGADMRHANVAGATLDGAMLTGAKIGGIQGRAKSLSGVRVDWADASREGDRSISMTGAQVVAMLSGEFQAPMAAPPKPVDSGGRRFFGQGDVLRNAELEFLNGAMVEIQSRFEGCSIALGDGVELVIGKSGVLSGCQITGAGKITVAGEFMESESPGIVGPREVIVTQGGSLIAAIEQPSEEATKFAFEPGCKLRMKIQRHRPASKREKRAAKNGRKE